MRITVADRIIDLETGEILVEGTSQAFLPPRVLALLRYLVDHADQVVARDDLIEGVWGHLEAATEDSVNVAVSALRKALDDQDRPHRIIVTIPRRGYRLVRAELEFIEESSTVDESTEYRTSPPHPPASATQRMRTGFRAIIAATVLAAVIGIAALWKLSDPESTFEDPPPARNPGRPAVAVLPFSDMSMTGDHAPFANGLVDRILHMLAESDRMLVIARTSSFVFRDSSLRAREIGELLNVDAILEGSIQADGDQIRVVAQLIDTRTEGHIWSMTFDRGGEKLFSVQDEIANAVSQSMTDSLLSDAVLQSPGNREVYELLTEASLETDRFTATSLNRAVSMIERALRIEPDNVEALVLMMDALSMLRTKGPMRQPDDTDIVAPYLARAQAIAPDHPEVLRAAGNSLFSQGLPDKAIESLQRAIRLRPNDAKAHVSLGRILFRLGRFDDADEILERARRLDPVSPRLTVWQADVLWSLGRAEEAVFQLRENLRLNPDFPTTYERLATYLVQMGESGQAMRYMLEQHRIDPQNGAAWARMCEFYLQLGDDESAERCTDELEAEHDLPLRIPYMRQILYAFHGRWQAQQEVLESIRESHPYFPLVPAVLAHNYYFMDQCEQALPLIEQWYPGVLSTPPDISPFATIAAVAAVYCLHQQAPNDLRTLELMDTLNTLFERIRLRLGPWQVVGHETARMLAIEGRYDEALDELDRLVDSDWRYYWWQLDAYPEFREIASTKRFKQMQERLESGVAEQRAWFEANKDTPIPERGLSAL